jgi:hypothetical protein
LTNNLVRMKKEINKRAVQAGIMIPKKGQL